MLYNGKNKFNDDSGILTSREILDSESRLSFIRKLLNTITYPTMIIINALNENSINTENLATVMQVFSSVHIDSDLFNVSIIADNLNTKLLKEIYERNGFYMINAEPAIEKINKSLTILFTFYKDFKTSGIDFLSKVKSINGEILGYLYIKEILGLSMKNYKNKFTLANKAKVFLMQNNPNMDGSLRDQAAICLSKMAMEFHLNSLLIDNFTSSSFNDIKLNNNMNYLRNNPFILYDPKYTYKMTHTDILNDLLEDAIIEYVDSSDLNNFMNQNTNEENNDDQEDIEINEDNEDQEDIEINKNNSEKNIEINNIIEENIENNEENNDDSDEDSDEDNEEINYDNLRNSPYANTNQMNNNNLKIDDESTKFIRITFKSNNHKIFFMNMPAQKPNDRYQSLDYADEESIHRMQSSIDVGMQGLKGTGLNSIIEQIGKPIEMDIPWDEKYLRFVNNNTYAVNSAKSVKSWSKSNIYTKHIAYLPGNVKLPETYPTFYVIFDQSGSMSNNTIRKINGLIETLYKNKYDVNILIHDYAQTADEVDVYELRPRNNVGFNDNVHFYDLIESRSMAGGTSHKGVFDLMEIYIKDVTSGDKKYSIHYPLICSDLESDILDIYKGYEWIKLLNNNIKIVTTIDCDIQLPFGETYRAI